MKQEKSIITILLILPLLIISCSSEKKGSKEQAEKSNNKPKSAMHKKHNQLANEFAHKDIIILDTAYQVNDSIQPLFNGLIDKYLQLAESLVNSNTNAADKQAGKMTEKVKSIPVQAFEEEGLHAWKQHAELYTDKLKEMQHIKGLEKKRSYFGHISEIMYCTVKSFNVQPVDLYVAYCPMALNGKGAYWLADTDTLRNPYYGDKMLNCGEIKEEL